MAEPGDGGGAGSLEHRRAYFERQRACFERVCDLSSEQAEAALAGEDPVLAAEVRSLLAADRGADGAPDWSAISPFDGLDGLPGSEPEPLPDRVGRYEILGLLGQGGMGLVYEARQVAPQRAIALKLLRPGLLSAERLRRFRHEAQALGRLNHPGIAQVYEAGSASFERGEQPYIAMELVRGERLDHHARRHRLGVRARLERVAELCDALQHAHEQGVVHRDLKPANVLVSDAGALKVLDFGVARMAGTDLETLTEVTGPGEVLGTLPYMSPEQVRGDPARVDGRSDVYAVGVIAYELLTGRLPLDVSSSSLPEAARAIVQDEPTALGRVDRRLRGDVEVIVGRALEKDPARRYASAAELAADVRRHLADEPIRARPPSRAYQLRKFTRRHRELVVGASLAFAVLLAGAVTSTVLYLRSQGNLRRAELAEGEWKTAALSARTNLDRAETAELEWRTAAEQARIEAGLAGQVSDFLVELFEVSDPSGRAGAEVPALELLDRGRRRIVEQLAEQPAVRARLMNVIGRVYFGMGQYGRAEPLIETTLETLRAEEEPDPLQLADALFSLGEIRHYRGLYTEIRPLYEEALVLRRAHLPPGHEDVRRSIDVLARLFRDLGGPANTARGRELAEEAYRLRLEAGADDFELSESLQTLGTLSLQEGELSEAGRLVEQALAMREVLAGERFEVAFRVPELVHCLGMIEQLRGDLDRAEQLFAEALERSRACMGPRHVFLTHSLMGLASVAQKRGRTEEARRLLAEAQELTTENDDGIRNLLGLQRAFALHDAGRWEEAEAAYLEVIEDYAERVGSDHPHTAVALNDLATLRNDQGQYEEAEALLRESLAIYRESAPGNATLCFTLRNLAWTLERLDRAEEAVPFALEAERLHVARFGRGSPDHRKAVQVLVQVLERAGRIEEAAVWRAQL